MTREKEIDNAKNAFYKRILEDGYYYDPRDCFEEGADWADANPKSPWISVEDDLPCNYKELINKSYEDETLPVISFVHGYVCLSEMQRVNEKWYWKGNEPEYWFPIPKLPKE